MATKIAQQGPVVRSRLEQASHVQRQLGCFQQYHAHGHGLGLFNAWLRHHNVHGKRNLEGRHCAEQSNPCSACCIYFGPHLVLDARLLWKTQFVEAYFGRRSVLDLITIISKWLTPKISRGLIKATSSDSKATPNEREGFLATWWATNQIVTRKPKSCISKPQIAIKQATTETLRLSVLCFA